MLRRHLTYRTGTLVFLWAAITDAIVWAVTTDPVTIRLLPVLTVVCLFLHICRSYSETTPEDFMLAETRKLTAEIREMADYDKRLADAIKRQVDQQVPVAGGYKVTDKRRLVTWDDSPEPVVHMVDWTSGATLRGRS